MPTPPFVGRVIMHAHRSLPTKASAMLKSGRKIARFFAFQNADQAEARSGTRDPLVRGRKPVYTRLAKEVKQSVVRPWRQPVRPPVYRPTCPSLREARPWWTDVAIP